MNINCNKSATGSIWRAIKFRCTDCGHDRLVHEGSQGGDGFSCWWNGYCEKCEKPWEVDSETEVERTGEYA
ncbi:hypothetical protein KNT87_gp035 [Erwinia phage Cronus]|uniref:Uncharacterized protein n=1 Tax=Erwinia phage Cronus TaxID=2163633 RepID=A0A2S1GM71_9CAUD|nr:hypothetical protein KNT87_gp035 [Erwinia phage Cronus]AWD90474.1 hypothetical protein [Erwinia phage Cronus]